MCTYDIHSLIHDVKRCKHGQHLAQQWLLAIRKKSINLRHLALIIFLHLTFTHLHLRFLPMQTKYWTIFYFFIRSSTELTFSWEVTPLRILKLTAFGSSGSAGLNFGCVLPSNWISLFLSTRNLCGLWPLCWVRIYSINRVKFFFSNSDSKFVDGRTF